LWQEAARGEADVVGREVGAAVGLAGTAAGLGVLTGAGNGWADARDENINEAAIVVIATLIPDERAGIDVTGLETGKAGVP
jgi:hypothetical protein